MLHEEEDLSPDQKIANAVSLLLASYKINPATTGHDAGHEGKRSRSRGNHRLLKQKRQEELAEVNQFVESVQAELKKRSPDNKHSTTSMKRKTETEPLTLCRFPKRRPRSRDTLKNCSQNFSQSEQSQRNSVDSATSATQIKLSKCYHGLRNLQAAMDVYESGAPLPPWIAHLLGTGTQRSSTTVREGLANLAGIIRLRVDGVLREKVKAES